MRGATKTRSRRREWLEPIALEADAEDLVAVRVHERGGPATRASRSTPRGAFRGRRSTDRRLTGVVQRIGTCTMLLVAPRRWALVGPVAATLKAGERITVTGPVAPSPQPCVRNGAEQAIHVTHASKA